MGLSYRHVVYDENDNVEIKSRENNSMWNPIWKFSTRILKEVMKASKTKD